MHRDSLKRIWNSCDRFIDVFLLHLIVVQGVYFSVSFCNTRFDLVTTELDFNGKLLPVTCLILMPLVFYSLVRMSVIYSEPLMARFFEVPEEEWSFRKKLRFLFRQKTFWFAAAAWVALYLLLPLKWTYAVLPDTFLNGQDSMAGKLYLLTVLFPLFFLLAIAAYFAAFRYWITYKKGKSSLRYVGESMQKAYRRMIISVVVVYAVIAMFVCMLLPVFLSMLLPIIWTLIWPDGIIALAIGIAVAAVLFRLQGLIKRRKFLKRLKRMERDHLCEVTGINRPYRSVFALYDGESFRVKRNGKEYACKLVSALRKSRPMVIHENGVYELIRSKYIPFGQRGYDFGFDADCQKVLILSPTPKLIFDSRMRQLDNGDTVGGYKLYTGTAFLNALERDCIDHNLNR